MIDFLNTITQLILNILGYLKFESSITLICFCMVFYVFRCFRDMFG